MPEDEAVRAGLMCSAGTRKLCFKVFLFEPVLNRWDSSPVRSLGAGSWEDPG